MDIYVIVYDNCGNGNDEFDLEEAFATYKDAKEKTDKLNKRIGNYYGCYEIHTIQLHYFGDKENE